MAFSVDLNRKVSERLLSTPAVFNATSSFLDNKAALITNTALLFRAFSSDLLISQFNSAFIADNKISLPVFFITLFSLYVLSL